MADAEWQATYETIRKAIEKAAETVRIRGHAEPPAVISERLNAIARRCACDLESAGLPGRPGPEAIPDIKTGSVWRNKVGPDRCTIKVEDIIHRSGRQFVRFRFFGFGTSRYDHEVGRFLDTFEPVPDA
jgi:hypothetical protein